MKITSNLYNKNVAFGYDKQLNKEVKAAISTLDDKEWASTLSRFSDFVNDVEDKLVVQEKIAQTTDVDTNYWDFLDLFLSLKDSFSGFISTTFGDLNYADREIVHYNDEFVKNGSNPDDWRSQACNVLKDYASNDVQEKLKNGTLSSSSYQQPNMMVDTDVQKEQQSKPTDSVASKSAVSLSSKSILEEYQQTPASPRGFKDVAGMETLKSDLRDGIIEFIENPAQAQLDFEEYGKTIPKAILLYGPPGCGKTYITQALSSEIDMPLYLLNISKAGSEYINMTSKNIKDAFDEAISIAKQTDKPCLLFMDEIDSMAFDRTSGMQTDDLKQVATVLQSMDLAKSQNVIILGATNKYDILDPAIRRRFDSKVYVGVPDNESRIALLKKNLSPLAKGQKLLTSDSDLEAISILLNGYSSSSICNISKQAALNALKRNRSDIAVEDYKKAIADTSEEKPNSKDYIPDAKRSSAKIGFHS